MIDEMKIVDLRSDTVTLPTVEMMRAIREARLGDDQYREDPTVNELQVRAADRLGKEDALLVVSGTQANLISILSQTQRGHKVILEEESHIYYSEKGGISAIAGLIAHTVKGRFGVPDPSDLRKIAEDHRGYHQAKPTLLCLENTHNRAGGTCITPDQTNELTSTARSYGMNVHIDGARIFNAAVALNVDIKDLTRNADSVTFCLSKGLSCPLGSIIAGNREFIEKARIHRLMLGGAMRQAGIIAAPGLVAIESMIDRLKDDHINAKTLAEGLVEMGVKIDMERVQTNIVLIDVSQFAATASDFILRVEKEGVKASNYGPATVRMVTHRGIEKEDIEYAIEAINRALKHIGRNEKFVPKKS